MFPGPANPPWMSEKLTSNDDRVPCSSGPSLSQMIVLPIRTLLTTRGKLNKKTPPVEGWPIPFRATVQLPMMTGALEKMYWRPMPAPWPGDPGKVIVPPSPPRFP